MMKANSLILGLLICVVSFANDSIPTKKNYIGVDINYFEFNFLTVFSGSLDLKYIRTLHKRVDINTTLGMTYPYLPFIGIIEDKGSAFKYLVMGKATVVPCYTPLRRENKTLQLGVGYAVQFQKDFALNGLTVQLNYLKQSKKKKFSYGVNFYNDVLFYKKENFPFYTVGVGFFFGGIF